MEFAGSSLRDASQFSEAVFQPDPAGGVGLGNLATEASEPAALPEPHVANVQTLPPRSGENPEESCGLSAAARTEGGIDAAPGSKNDALTLLSSRNRPHKVWRKRYVKLLVVGDAGLGKTTLIRTLLSVPEQKVQLHDGSETGIEQFRKSPASMCSRICLRDEEDRVEWYYTIQDTPGYGDKINIRHNIEAMVEFVTLQNQKWFDIENSKKRPADMSVMEDPRIDVCLFCLPPHRLRYVDVRFMHELGKVVPIIPIITKADTMNIREATIYRQEVHSKLQNMGQFGLKGKIELFEFQKETLGRAGVDPSISQFKTLPFLIVASNEINAELSQRGRFWPERQYAWGTCEAFNPDHSDFMQLYLLLLKEGLEELSASKLERYELWRRRRLSQLRLGFNLKVVILATTAFAAFRVGKSLANGRSPRRIFVDAAQAVWRQVRQLPHPRWRKRTLSARQRALMAG